VQKKEKEMIREKLVCKDSHVLYYHVWQPKVELKAVLHIQHGMAEHSSRYDEFAKFLANKGIKVYAQDHRGHGYTGEKEVLGFFSEVNGWDKVISDALELSNKIISENPKVPLFLMGHSMGSFIARVLTAQNPDLYCATIVMGTGADPGLKGKIGKMIAKNSVKKKGAHFLNKKLNDMSFGSYNKKFDANGSAFQWLSRDEKQVEKYEKDPWCGFICTSSFYYDLLNGIFMANNLNLAKNIDKNYPMLLISGNDDPVGNYGKGLKKVKNFYEKAGLQNVTLVLVEDARHEILNEIDKEKTYQIVASWIEEKI